MRKQITSAIALTYYLTGCAATPAAVPTMPPPTAAAAATVSVPTATAIAATLAPTVMSSTPTTMPTQAPPQTPPTTDAFIRAAEAGDSAAVTQMLKAGVAINGRDAQGRTAIMAATHANKVEVVRLLIQAGADINIRDNRLDNPFLYAGVEGLLDILQLAIDAKADPKLTNRFGGTALIPAAERGHVEVVKTLLTRSKVDVNHVNNLGWTALLEAIVLSNGGPRHQQIVQLLVDYGADIHIADKSGVTPLKHAQTRGFKEIERILNDSVNRNAQLIVAAAAGDLALVKQFLAQGASVHARDVKGKTALIAAAYRNDMAIANVLIDAGADVNAQDNTKQSAYLISTSEGYVELLKRTLQAGANVHSLDSYNGTGLIRAADRGRVEIIQELLKTDIKLDHINRLGWTALLEAIILGDGGPRHTEVVRLLVKAGANVNIADSGGTSPLAHARRRGQTQIIEILQQAGAR